MIPILAWSIFGTQIALSLAFPMCYLLFAVPIGDFLVPPLQDLTASISVSALRMSGIPVFWEGRFFQIPSGSFEVAEACSGLHYLIALLALSTLYAYLTYCSYWRRLVFIVISILVAILANGIRAYGIVLLAHYSNYKLAVGEDHLVYGWLFFGVVTLLLFWVGSWFREDPPLMKISDKNEGDEHIQGTTTRSFIAWASLATALAITAPAFSAWLDSQHSPLMQNELVLPKGQNGWEGPHVGIEGLWRPHFVGALEYRGEYLKDNNKVQVYLAYYPVQAQGAELINWKNRLYDEDSSRSLGESRYQVPLSSGKHLSVHETQVESADGNRLIWHWYVVDGSSTISRTMAKVYEVRGHLRASKRGPAAWVLATKYELGPHEAENVLNAFLQDMLPALSKVVDQ